MTSINLATARYQICDACCGQVETASSLKKAMAIAVAHVAKHAAEGDAIELVEVHDRMARRDCVDTWQCFRKPEVSR